MTFTWNEANEESHIIKHKISFSTAAFFFINDPDPYIYEDLNHPDDPKRMIAIASYNDRYLWISFAEPEEEGIHIISARLATKAEINLYYERPY